MTTFLLGLSQGVCGHLLDSLSACDHSATLMKPEQARFWSFGGHYVFWKASPQTEGRRNADPGIKTGPASILSLTQVGYTLEETAGPLGRSLPAQGPERSKKREKRFRT